MDYGQEIINYVIELKGLLTVFCRLDCVYRVLSNMLMLCKKKQKKNILFHIIYLYSTPLCP